MFVINSVSPPRRVYKYGTHSQVTRALTHITHKDIKKYSNHNAITKGFVLIKGIISTIYRSHSRMPQQPQRNRTAP